MTWPWSSLRVRLLLVVLLAVVPALGLILYMAAEQRRLTIDHVQGDALDMVQQIALEQSDLIESAHQLLTALAQLPEVKTQSARACSDQFQKLLKKFGRYANLGAATPDGRVFCSALRVETRVNLADRAYLRRAVETRDFAIGEYQIGRLSGKASVNFGYPVTGPTGEVRAVVFAALDLGWLGQRVRELQLLPGSRITVFDRNGTVLAHHPDAAVRVGGTYADVPIVRTIMERRQGVAEGRDIDGSLRLFAFWPLDRRGAAGNTSVSVAVPSDVALASVQRTLVRSLGALGIASLLALAAAWIGGDLFVRRRVSRLVDAARRLGAGDLAARIDPGPGRGELDHLARSFNEMAAGLERQAAELREGEARYRGLVEGSIEGIYVHKRFVIQLANSAMARIFGYESPDALAGRDVRDLWVPEDRARLEGYARARLRGEPAPARYEFRGLRRDGATIWCESTASVVAWEGEPAVLVTLVDITDAKRAEEALQRQREALSQSEKLAAMGSLLAGVAHELNNPLAVLIGQAHLMGQALAGGREATRAEKIRAAAERCARIVKNFLALARQHPPERHDVRLDGIVREAVELLAYPLRSDGVEVDLRLAPDLPALWADPHQIHQVLVNLIANAYQAMRETPPPRRLTITARALAPARIELTVADSGPGIPAAIQTRIFEPFFTTKPVGQGTGLGLSLCRSMIEAHGGTIGVESRPGHGATFTIELPVQTPDGRAEAARPPDAAPPTRARTVLVVDDETDVAEVLADMLRADGHRVETAANGRLALEALARGSFDLILSDLRMPELGGPELYREIERRHPALARRFVFVTGDTLSTDAVEFAERAGAPTLSKPFVPDEVRRVVHRVAGA